MDAQDPKFDKELYEHLVAENAKYIEKVHQTWNQKLVIVGAMVSFVLINHGKMIEGSSPLPLRIAILAIPVLCIILDAHLLEKALQARVISHFLIREFEDSGKSRGWCRLFWSVGADADREKRGLFRNLMQFWTADGTRVESIVGLRSASTAIVSIVPTVLVVFMSISAAYPSYPREALTAASIGSVLYFVVAAIVFRSLRKQLDGEGPRG